MRGIVISPEYEVTREQGIFLKNSSIDSSVLRQYLMYWDKLDFPDNNLVRIGRGDQEADFLMSAGILQRTMFDVNHFNGNVYAEMQSLALEKNNKINEGGWSLAQPNKALVLNEDSSNLTRSLEIELYESLPVPSTEVPIEKILEFKEKRRDELLEFRHVMDEFYLEMNNSSDVERTKLKNIETLELKLKNIHQLMDESSLKKTLGSVKIELDIKEMIIKTGAGVWGALEGYYPLSLGIGGGILSSLNIRSETSLKPSNLPEGVRDYAYLYYAQKEFN